jgi:hypothetical protein
MTNAMKVGELKLTTPKGKVIRNATVIYREDGKAVVFMEKMSARKAAMQAAGLPESAWR